MLNNETDVTTTFLDLVDFYFATIDSNGVNAISYYDARLHMDCLFDDHCRHGSWCLAILGERMGSISKAQR